MSVAIALKLPNWNSTHCDSGDDYIPFRTDDFKMVVWPQSRIVQDEEVGVTVRRDNTSSVNDNDLFDPVRQTDENLFSIGNRPTDLSRGILLGTAAAVAPDGRSRPVSVRAAVLPISSRSRSV